MTQPTDPQRRLPLGTPAAEGESAVIVSCPNCQVRYRVSASDRGAKTARCSRCQAEFPLARNPSYRLVAAAVGAESGGGGGAEPRFDWPDMPPMTAPSPQVPPPGGGAEGDWPEAPPTRRRSSADEPAATARKGPAKLVVRLLACLICVVVGAITGYYLSVFENGDLRTFVGIGSGVGLAAGLAHWLWAPRRS